ncbi:MAG: hypothetical protein LBJ92_02470 [Holosporales bacterium]|jgi:hypothetical protein|nr:hypothetical protein [Holosporales bacterium]
MNRIMKYGTLLVMGQMLADAIAMDDISSPFYIRVNSNHMRFLEGKTQEQIDQAANDLVNLKDEALRGLPKFKQVEHIVNRFRGRGADVKFGDRLLAAIEEDLTRTSTDANSKDAYRILEEFRYASAEQTRGYLWEMVTWNGRKWPSQQMLYLANKVLVLGHLPSQPRMDLLAIPIELGELGLFRTPALSEVPEDGESPQDLPSS